MGKKNEAKITVEKCFQVECAFDKSHVFPVKFTMEEGQVSPVLAKDVDVFCPYCGKMVSIQVKGELPPDRDIFRGHSH